MILLTRVTTKQGTRLIMPMMSLDTVITRVLIMVKQSLLTVMRKSRGQIHYVQHSNEPCHACMHACMMSISDNCECLGACSMSCMT